jgi:hypothetical protein
MGVVVLVVVVVVVVVVDGVGSIGGGGGGGDGGKIPTVLMKNLDVVPGKHSVYSTTKDSCTWNITHNTESTAV